MKDFKVGHTHTIKKVVTNADSAIAYSSGTVNVFATPAMIALMEETALKGVAPFLPEAQTTVGFEVNIRHLKAVMVGEEVISHIEVIQIEKRKHP